HELSEPPQELLAFDRVVVSRPWLEPRGLRLLVARGERAVPVEEGDHGTCIVAEVAQQPPQPLGAAERAVGDDVDAGADARAARGLRELGLVGERVAAARPRWAREVAVDVEERGPRDVPRQILAAAPVGIVE